MADPPIIAFGRRKSRRPTPHLIAPDNTCYHGFTARTVGSRRSSPASENGASQMTTKRGRQLAPQHRGSSAGHSRPDSARPSFLSGAETDPVGVARRQLAAHPPSLSDRSGGVFHLDEADSRPTVLYQGPGPGVPRSSGSSAAS